MVALLPLDPLQGGDGPVGPDGPHRPHRRHARVQLLQGTENIAINIKVLNGGTRGSTLNI